MHVGATVGHPTLSSYFWRTFQKNLSCGCSCLSLWIWHVETSYLVCLHFSFFWLKQVFRIRNCHGLCNLKYFEYCGYKSFEGFEDTVTFSLGTEQVEVALRMWAANDDHGIGQWNSLEASQLFQMRTLATSTNFLKCYMFKIESECVQTAWVLQDPYRSDVSLTNELTFRFYTETW